MDPVFIYYDKVKFQNNDYKIFKVDFSAGDNLEGVFFQKKQRFLYNKHVFFYNSRTRLESVEALRRYKKDIRNF